MARGINGKTKGMGHPFDLELSDSKSDPQKDVCELDRMVEFAGHPIRSSDNQPGNAIEGEGGMVEAMKIWVVDEDGRSVGVVKGIQLTIRGLKTIGEKSKKKKRDVYVCAKLSDTWTQIRYPLKSPVTVSPNLVVSEIVEYPDAVSIKFAEIPSTDPWIMADPL
jgi:hypothetical protein